MICLGEGIVIERNLTNQENQGEEIVVDVIACDKS